MKIMLRFLTLAMLVGCCWSCSNNDESGATYNKTYITGYINPEAVTIKKADRGIEFTLKGTVTTSGDTFSKLSAANGDTSFNRYTVCGPRIALSDPINSIKIETSDAFDLTHPAGSDVSELVECAYVSYFNYVKSGYQAAQKDATQYAVLTEYAGIEGAEVMTTKLSDINFATSQLISKDFAVEFTAEPAQKGTHQFKLIVQTPTNRIEAPFTYDF